jgi:tetratricopeptide (TPR) repeat protein
VHDLEKLMYYAVSSEYIQAQEKIGKKIVSLSPSSATSWQRLAQTACQQGDYKLASHALRKFFALCKNHCKDYPDFYESLYDCALVLDKNHKHAKAEKFYHLALDQICKSKDITFAMREKQILILDKLGLKTQAFTKMNEFYDLSSRDPSVAAVAANMLMDHGDLNQARHLLEAVMAEEIAVYRSQCKGSFYPAEEKNCPLQDRGPFDCNDAPIKHDKESFCTPSNTKEK